MGTNNNSSAPLRRLGAELRRLREAATLRQAELAEKVGRSHVSVVNWEHGKTRIGKGDLSLVLSNLSASEDAKEQLEELRVKGKDRGWWAVYNLPDWLRPLVSFEADAVRITSFEPVIIPGLLQTEAYSRAIHEAGPHTTPPEELECRVELRNERQRRLVDDAPLELHVVIAEAALRLEVGGPEVMAGQIWNLVRLASARSVRIQVLPYRAGAHAGVLSNLAVLHFEDAKLDPPIGYVDGPLGGQFIPNRQDVNALRNMFEQVSALALSETDSVDFLANVRSEYGSAEPKKARRKGRNGP